MKIEPYKHISKYTLKKFEEGATIVDLLTDWKTPCYIYQIKPESIKSGIIRAIDTKLIAVNNGIKTYAETSNATHIFGCGNKNNFTIPYLSGKKIILYTKFIPVCKHVEKQLPQRFFSRFVIEGNVEDLVKDIVKEFTNEGYKTRSCEDLKDSELREIYFKLMDKQANEIDSLEKKAREFYKSHGRKQK